MNSLFQGYSKELIRDLYETKYRIKYFRGSLSGGITITAMHCATLNDPMHQIWRMRLRLVTFE